MEWDFFLSHASEDKDYVRTLVLALQSQKIKVWYDEFTLKIGASLRRQIDHGLTHSRFGIVILSKYFFSKEWPQKELDGLTALQSTGLPTIIPIWHGVTHKEVCQFSPTLADIVSLSSTEPIETTVAKLGKLIPCYPRPNQRTKYDFIIAIHHCLDPDDPMPNQQGTSDKGMTDYEQVMEILLGESVVTQRAQQGDNMHQAFTQAQACRQALSLAHQAEAAGLTLPEDYSVSTLEKELKHRKEQHTKASLAYEMEDQRLCLEDYYAWRMLNK